MNPEVLQSAPGVGDATGVGLRISGSPDPVEVAAVTAVILATVRGRASARNQPDTTPTSVWCEPRRLMRPPLPAPSRTAWNLSTLR